MTEKTIPIRFLTGSGITAAYAYTDYETAVGDIRFKGGFVMLFTPREAKRVMERYEDKSIETCVQVKQRLTEGVAVMLPGF